MGGVRAGRVLRPRGPACRLVYWDDTVSHALPRPSVSLSSTPWPIG
jgi:hypothetical protein